MRLVCCIDLRINPGEYWPPDKYRRDIGGTIRHSWCGGIVDILDVKCRFLYMLS